MKILAHIHHREAADRLNRLAENEVARRRALQSLASVRRSPEHALLRVRFA